MPLRLEEIQIVVPTLRLSAFARRKTPPQTANSFGPLREKIHPNEKATQPSAIVSQPNLLFRGTAPNASISSASGVCNFLVCVFSHAPSMVTTADRVSVFLYNSCTMVHRLKSWRAFNKLAVIKSWSPKRTSRLNTASSLKIIGPKWLFINRSGVRPTLFKNAMRQKAA